MAGRGIVILLALLASALATHCKGQKPPSVMDYPNFVRWNVKSICTKMLVCYEKYYRGAAPAQRSRITQTACEATALDDIERKLSYHTPAMKLYSAQCYGSILQSNCREFAMVALWDPGCLALRRATREAAAKLGGQRKRPKQADPR